jgi:hypothetical protein
MENISLQKNFFWFVNKSEMSPGGQVYLGAFLAVAFFAALYTQNLLFIMIIITCSVFIFLSKDKSEEQVLCSLERDFIYFENKAYMWNEVKSYSFVDLVWDKEVKILLLQNKNVLEPKVFIPIDKNVEINKIRVIIPKLLREDKDVNLTFADKVMIRFFI